LACSVCSGSFQLADGLCVPIEASASGVVQTYVNIKIITEYINSSNLKISLIFVGGEFVKME
jgi:hypothetical protein